MTLTAEQEQWQEAAERLAAAHAVTSPSAIPTGDAVDRGWRSVVDLGVPALRSPALSGADAAAVESVLAVEQLARHLTALPVLGQAVIAPQLLEAAGADELVAGVAEGTRRIAPTLTADLTAFGRRGAPAVALDAAGATHALLLEGSRLVAVPITRPPLGALDLTRGVHEVDPDATPDDLPLGGAIDDEALTRTHALALTAVAADLLGVMHGGFLEALQYAKDRRQFGTAIGSFQAVQHLLADALVAIEGTRSCVWHAAWAVDHLGVDDALLAARTAKAHASESGRRVVEATVQVFGGIAITWEHLSHLRLRRMHLDRACFGDEQVQYQQIAAHRLDGKAVA